MNSRSRGFTRLTVIGLLGLGVLLGASNHHVLGFGAPAVAAAAQHAVSNGVIAFTGGSANASLDTINPSGSHLRTLAYCRTTACFIGDYVWSHDGKHIAFVRGRPVRSPDYYHPYRKLTIYVVKADGTGEKRLLGCGSPRGCLAGLWFDWSPDDTRLAIARNGRLFVLNLKTHGLRQLTHCHTACFDLKPRWSPDGSRIVFARDPNHVCLGRCGAPWYVVNVDGSGLKKLGNWHWPDIVHDAPSWSPDGRRIALIHHDGLYTVNADGSQVRRLVPGYPWTKNHRIVIDGSWDPSGAWILYESAHFGSTSNPIQAWVIRPNGMGRRLVYHSSRFGGDATMAWSPDGKKLIINTDGGLFIMDSDGSHVQRILLQSVGTPKWQPLP